MARSAVITLLLFCCSGAANAYTLASYIEAKESVKSGGVGNPHEAMLEAYHQGIAETVQTLLVAKPQGKILGEGFAICLNASVVNRQLIEDVIARSLSEGMRGEDISPTVLVWVGLLKMAPCN